MKLAIIFLILTAFVLVVVKWQGAQYQSFMEKSEKIAGVITKKEERSFRSNQQTGKENWIRYRFNIGGIEYTGEEKVEYADLWHDMSEGQAIEIYYNRENPAENHPATVLDKRLAIANKL